MNKAIIIDGNSLFYRAYFATKDNYDYAISKDLVPNNGIVTIFRMFKKIFDKDLYKYCLIAFDHGEKTFRHESDVNYKSNRNATPDDLIKQMLAMKEIFEGMGFKTLSKENFEADDLIGSACKLFNNNNIDVEVYSSDKDMLQLVNEKTNVNLLKRGVSDILQYNNDNFQEQFFNLKPEQIVEFKGLVGDSSDSLKGVAGIGEKTGVKLLNQYQNIDNIYTQIDTLEVSLNIKNKLLSGKDEAYRCREMSRIVLNLFEHENIVSFIIRDEDLKSIISIIEEYRIHYLFN